MITNLETTNYGKLILHDTTYGMYPPHKQFDKCVNSP